MKAHELIRAALADAAVRLGVSLPPSAVELELPRDPAHGDVATNLALALAKSLRQKPQAIESQHGSMRGAARCMQPFTTASAKSKRPSSHALTRC